MENGFELMLSQNALAAAIRETRSSNDISSRWGLALTDAQAANVAQRRIDALKATDRVEFGGGIIRKLVYAFCDSPYIFRENYEQTLIDLQDAFYYFKNESHDMLSDDELIEYMVKEFNGKAQGSLEYLTGTFLPELARRLREDGKWNRE